MSDKSFINFYILLKLTLLHYFSKMRACYLGGVAATQLTRTLHTHYYQNVATMWLKSYVAAIFW